MFFQLFERHLKQKEARSNKLSNVGHTFSAALVAGWSISSSRTCSKLRAFSDSRDCPVFRNPQGSLQAMLARSYQQHGALETVEKPTFATWYQGLLRFGVK